MRRRALWRLAILLLAAIDLAAADRVPVNTHAPAPLGGRWELGVDGQVGVGGCELARDRRGKLRRRSAVRSAFRRATGHARGRPGWQIDHIIPLRRGGCDCIENLQWLPAAAKRAKDRVE